MFFIEEGNTISISSRGKKKNAYEIQLGSRGHLLRPTKKTLTLISTVTIK